MRLHVNDTLTLSTNNFGNNHFGKSSENKIFLDILEDYNSVCSKNFQQMQQKLENAFWPNFQFFENFIILKN